ncbi:endolytic transglycosylase MltG [Nonomuraea sp. NPDC046570]|uniref:endolytic transglycosylase MltG n=1 Tax=Nonomuraea sp. NPDC046570 TaxID=3155255 RepID=UPI0033D4430D
MNDLDMDFLLGAEDDDGRSGRRSRGSAKNGGRGRRRRRRRNRGGFMAPLLALIVLVGVIGGGGYYGYLWLSDALVPDDFPGPGKGEVLIEIHPGDSAAALAQTLEEKGVVASARGFSNAIAAAGKSASLQPGTYTLRKEMSAAQAVAMFDPKSRMLTKVPVPEGLRLTELVTLLAKTTGKPVKEFTAAAKDAKALGLPPYARKRLEGYAFPATYEFGPKMTPADMLAKMVERFNSAAEQADLEGAAKRLGHTPHEIVTIASIIQAESGTFDDMPKVARVIYNRLDRDPQMKLEMDSTVMYALNKFGIAATNADLETTSKYNTYRYLGLPPGPISNPGDHAIEAALNPAKGSWMYFVTTDPKNKVTKFATTEAEFLKLKAEFEQNRN